jgi:hypothetical protein
MTLVGKAKSLAAQMNVAGLRPGEEKNHPAWQNVSSRGGLAYAMVAGQPVLGEFACSIYGHETGWVVFDAHGSRGVTIVWDGDAWQQGPSV